MAETFDKYHFKRNEHSVQLDYTYTSKDWLDFSILTLGGLGSVSVFGFIIVQAIQNEFLWIYVVLIPLFGFVGTTKLIELLSRLSEPTKRIITINNKTKSIIIKKPHFRTEKHLITEVDCIDYSLHTDMVGISNRIPKRRYWIEVHILFKDKKRIKILNINPTDILDPGGKKTKRNLFKTAKPLISELSKCLSISPIYNGIIDEEKTSRNKEPNYKQVP